MTHLTAVYRDVTARLEFVAWKQTVPISISMLPPETGDWYCRLKETNQEMFLRYLGKMREAMYAGIWHGDMKERFESLCP